MTSNPLSARSRVLSPSYQRSLNRLTGNSSLVGFTKSKLAELTYNKYISKIRKLQPSSEMLRNQYKSPSEVWLADMTGVININQDTYSKEEGHSPMSVSESQNSLIVSTSRNTLKKSTFNKKVSFVDQNRLFFISKHKKHKSFLNFPSSIISARRQDSPTTSRLDASQNNSFEEAEVSQQNKTSQWNIADYNSSKISDKVDSLVRKFGTKRSMQVRRPFWLERKQRPKIPKNIVRKMYRSPE